MVADFCKEGHLAGFLSKRHSDFYLNSIMITRDQIALKLDTSLPLCRFKWCNF